MSDAMWQHDVDACVKEFRGIAGIEPVVWRCPCGTCGAAVLYAVGALPAGDHLRRTTSPGTPAPARVLWVMPTVSRDLQPLLMGLENMVEVDSFVERVAGYVKLRKVAGEHFAGFVDALYEAAKEIVS